MAAPLFSLACAACGDAYPDTGFPETCLLCGGFWRYGDGFAWRAPAEAAGAAAATAGSLRRWATGLGVDTEGPAARSLASPPGLYAPEDGAGEVWVCQQGSAPTGSYKERGAEVMAAAALRRGQREIFLDSSGNAGIAVARAAAARGIRCTVLVPETTPAIKIERIREAGGQVEVVPGDRDATHAAAQEWRRQLPGEGGDTEHWLLPAGNGPLLLGLSLGLSRLTRAGVIGSLPALHAVQLDGYAALAPGGPGEARPGAPTAAGIAIRR